MTQFISAFSPVFCYNKIMKNANKTQQKQGDSEALRVQKLIELLAEKDQLIDKQTQQLDLHQKHLSDKDHLIHEQQKYIALIEEQLRLSILRKFTASSEKGSFQRDLFDEAELEVALSELNAQLPDDAKQPPTKKTRKRGFSDLLPRVRIELTLSDEEKAGALSTFFSKVKEELEYIPAKVNVLEYWQEKAVFERDGQDHIISAQRPVHPLGKCMASPSLLAHIITSKYVDGLPLYRLEGILKRFNAEISRTNMANWIIRLDDVFKPLINLMKEEQLNSDYLQVDETRIQVLKETGKVATSDKWMWLIRGGPPDKPAVIFDYDPSRAGSVAERLLDGFTGVLQADGYSGYSAVCRKQNITRIGCWDHARRKFIESIKAAEPSKKTGKKTNKGQPSKADVALSKIRKLYAVEVKAKDLTVEEKRQARQQHSVPILNDLKIWLEKNVSRVPKDSLTYKAIRYTLNQWDYLTRYCEDGKLQISNVLAENAIRPFAVGRRAWLFADTSRGARASATCYSLVESAKANGLEPSVYLRHILECIGSADTVDKLEALLPWNIKRVD
jgi:transposase